jgi:hypothetical protein
MNRKDLPARWTHTALGLFLSLMNELFIALVESNSYIELAHLEVEGKGAGHGRIELDDRSIVLTAITKATAAIMPSEFLKVKATTLDGGILRLTGVVSSIQYSQRPSSLHTEYLQLVIQTYEVRACKSGKDPDENTPKALERITSNLAIKKLATHNAATITTIQSPTLGTSVRPKNDCLVIDENTFVVENSDLRIIWKPQSNQDINSGIPLLAAIAYLHGAPAWYYHQAVCTKEDEFYELRNNLKLPITDLTPLTDRLAAIYPQHAINVLKSIATLLSEHQFREQIHDVLHNFIVGTARTVDGVAATLLAVAATEGLCRVLQGQVLPRQRARGDAKQIITDTTRSLRLADQIIDPGLTSWERVRNTLAHGHFYRAHDRYINVNKPRSEDENIIHDLSRVSGLFHAILLKTAGYAGQFALSKFEDLEAEI